VPAFHTHRQVTAGPAKGGLEEVVQLAHGAITTHPDAPPDRRIEAQRFQLDTLPSPSPKKSSLA